MILVGYLLVVPPLVQGIVGKGGLGHGRHYRHGGATTLPSSLRYGGFVMEPLGVAWDVSPHHP